MALVTVTSGNPAKASDVQQIINLLTGVMTDQAVYIANTIRASTTGATTYTAFAGGTAGGAPTSGAHTAGDFIVDTVNKIMYICTVTGTPGTWATLGVQTDSTAGDYLSLVAAGAATVAGSVGKAADAGHQHNAKVNPGSGFSGNLFHGQLNGVDKFTVDQTGFLTAVGGANIADSTSNTIPTLPSANGARLWIQSTDPAGSARDGDLWVHG